MKLKTVSRDQLKSIAIRSIKESGGVCPLCLHAIDLTKTGRASDFVVDHDHETGEVRGYLHRSCNSAEGKVRNAVGQWGTKSVSYSTIIPWLERLLKYWAAEGKGYMYPDHKTPEQRAESARKRNNKNAALRRAKLRLMKEKQQ